LARLYWTIDNVSTYNFEKGIFTLEKIFPKKGQVFDFTTLLGDSTEKFTEKKMTV
jgi:hypothetical protein